MGYLNIISFFWLLLLFFYSRYVLKQNEVVRNRFLKIQLLFVLLYNIGFLFVFPWKIPIELSTTSYFVVPIIVLFSIKYLKAWGVYASILTGSIYFIGMLLMGNKLYSNFPPYSVYTSLYNHGALISYAIITLKTAEFHKSERNIIWVGLGLSAAWALLLRPLVTFTGRIFIYIVLEADLINTYFPNNLKLGFIIYYPLLIVVLVFSANVVHLLNRKLKKPFNGL